MLKKTRQSKKISRLIVFSFACLLVFFFALSWVNAKEALKLKLQEWQVNGIVAAMDDVYPGVQGLAFEQLGIYELKNLDRQKAESIAKKAAAILKNDKIDAIIRSNAASALGNIGLPAKSYVSDIVAIIKDNKVNANVRASALFALGSLGEEAKPYIPDILAIIKDNKVDTSVRIYAANSLGNLKEVVKSYASDIVGIIRDNKIDVSVRANIASALGNLGEVAKPYIPDVLAIIKDNQIDSYVRTSTASSLGNLKEVAKSYIPYILAIIKDDKVDAYVRANTASALGNFGEAAKSYIPDILAIVKDDKINANARGSAVAALGNLGEVAKSSIPDILTIIKDDKVNKEIRSRSAYALGNFGLSAKSYISDIAAILKDNKVDILVRVSIAEALGSFKEAAKSYIPDILAIIKDDKVDKEIRSRAAYTLSNFGSSAESYIPDVVAIFKDDKVDKQVRVGVAAALGNLGEAAESYIPDILAFFKDDKADSDVRYNALSVLGSFGSSAKSYVPDILAFIKDDSVNTKIRSEVASGLFRIEQLSIEQVITVLNLLYRSSDSEWDKCRFLTYFTAGGTDEVKTLLKYLGHYDPKKAETQLRQLNYDKAKKALNLFAKIWKSSEGMLLRGELAKQIALVASRVSWGAGDIVLLQGHYNNLKNVGYTQYDTIGRIIENLEYWKWIFAAVNTILTHLAVWLLLIFAYPRYPQIQAIFFWNPWVRRILGMGYVGFILTWVPFFRHKLLEPFKPSLLADAGLDGFNPDGYFPESNVMRPSGDILPVTQALKSVEGQIILEGDSGLGKSMFLRYLANNSKRIVVFLPADKCQKGVSEAIQDKLHGQAQDANFLKSLIYSGAIDIYIDGINEVSAETRANIKEFVEKHFRGNVIMATQPLEWIPPSTAKTYKLQLLTCQQIEQFLLRRTSRLGTGAKIAGDKYKKNCQEYLAEILDNQQPSSELDAASRILSNPMDLSLVSTMISQAQHPDLFNLQQQQYNLMSAEYQREWKHDFPLKKFSMRIYQLRCHDETALPVDEFNQEIMSMEDEKYKMVVKREWSDIKYGQPRKEWNFRHDKIMEFFLVQNFLDGSKEAEERQMKHMGDSRFRGVYFSLATLLPLSEAQKLQTQLMQYGAKTKDNTVFWTYVQILEARVAKQKGSGKSSP